MSVLELSLAAIIGGLLGLDAVSFPQVMVARPLAAAALGGLWAGEPLLGLWVGALLELLTMRQVPVGGARYHDTGPASFAAGLAYAGTGGGALPLLLATAAGLVFGWLGGWTVRGLRRLNGRLVASLGAGRTPPGRLVRRHVAAIGLDLARATVLAGLWIVLLRALLAGPGEPVPAWLGPVAAALLLAGAAAAVGAALRTFARGAEVWRAFVLGAGTSGVGLWLWS